MRTQQRLTEAYASARIEPFDDESRLVFMSDCHRGTGGLADEFGRNENTYLHALGHYYRNGFTYVEVGDGDELWENREFKHIKDAHYDVFTTIKHFFDEGRFILLWGNHNNYLRDPEYVREHLYTYYHDHQQKTYEFLDGIEPVEALVLRHAVTGQEILVVHGHQGDFANDQAWFLTAFSLKYYWQHLHALGVQNPASPARNAAKRHKIERNFSKWIAEHRMAVICGHTHRFKYPREGELPYFNSGSCIYPASLTAIELEAGEIRIVRWRIVAGPDGVLHVERQLLRGPDPVAKFDPR